MIFWELIFFSQNLIIGNPTDFTKGSSEITKGYINQALEMIEPLYLYSYFKYKEKKPYIWQQKSKNFNLELI